MRIFWIVKGPGRINERHLEVFAPFCGVASDTPGQDDCIHMPNEPGIGVECKSSVRAVLNEL